jgi:hypothetical protein
LSPTVRRGQGGADAFTGVAGKALAQVLAPGHVEAAVGRAQRPHPTPRAASSGTQAPSEPSRAQLPPPSASTVARLDGQFARGVSKRSAPFCHQPSQRWRAWNTTPAARSRCSQARSSGAAFISCGKTRPELPTKVDAEAMRPVAQVAAAESASQRPTARTAFAIARTKLRGLGMRQVEPAAAGQQELAPTDGMAS